MMENFTEFSRLKNDCSILPERKDLWACSRQAKVGTKAEISYDKQKGSKNKRQTSKKIFASASVFTVCEWVLKLLWNA